MEINQVIQYLKKQSYISQIDGQWILSDEFQQLCKLHISDIVVSTVNGIIRYPGRPTDWQQAFIGFIQEAKVPAKLEDHRGNLYAANKYNQDACKAFIKAIDKEGYDYSLLVKSTMLYYKSGIRLKKAIGTYFTSGEFRTDYLNLKTAAESGETQLKQHLKDETNNGEHNRYSLG